MAINAAYQKEIRDMDRNSGMRSVFRKVILSGLFLMGLAATIGVAQAQAPATLVQTIDLNTWSGAPVTIVQPPPPQPAPGFSLTGIAFDPVSHTLYVSDYASTNVYQIDSVSNSVVSAVYTNGLYTTADIGPAQDVPGTAPTVVLANPLTNRWMFTGEKGGAEFNGTAFAEPLTPRAMQSGAAWDPVTDNIYAADGLNWFATNNAKFLLFSGGGCNAVAVNPATSRVYASCGGSIGIYDGFVLSKASVKIPTPPLAVAPLNAQPMGLALNPNTNRIYLANGASIDILDASTYQLLASIPLPDQSRDFLIAGYMALPLPRPIAINTVTNTIFVVNSVTSTISVFDGNTNALIGTITIPTPDGAVVSQPLQPNTLLAEIKPGNTIYDSSAGMITTLGGAIAGAVDEARNMLYVASVNGTVSAFALNPSATPTAFGIYGVIRNANGLPAPGVAVNAAGSNGSASAVTDATGLFVLTGLPAGSYTITPRSPLFAFSPSSLTASINAANLNGLSFQANPPIVPDSYTVSPWTLIGPGVVTTGTVTLNQPAPAGGAVVTLSASDPKAAKFSSTVTVPAGQASVAFAVQGNGVSATTTVTLTAFYNGGTAAGALTVAPSDSLKITKATYSTSTHVLTVNATGTNAQSTLNIFVASNNQLLGTMINNGGGNYTFVETLAGSAPSSVNVVSNLGGKTGQGVTIIP